METITRPLRWHRRNQGCHIARLLCSPNDQLVREAVLLSGHPSSVVRNLKIEASGYNGFEVETMHKTILAAILLFAMTLSASASKIEGSTILKDSQPTGTIDKEHKHQAYDLS